MIEGAFKHANRSDTYRGITESFKTFLYLYRNRLGILASVSLQNYLLFFVSLFDSISLLGVWRPTTKL